ncbi:MAG TPA: Na+/H+ antiporter NhaA [Gemmatimonadales bacterium]|nr:Na+/H+ antiporter NhaA [Gemmatimonadales bacterium]
MTTTTPLSPPARAPLIERLVGPFQHFAHQEASSGLFLLGCTVVALAWANSPWAGAYHQLWEVPLAIRVGSRALEMSLHHWINDGLMAVFFFLVGLEIKREVLVGELASLRRSALPLAAAAGGMLVPALLYALVNRGGPGGAGWGIPMATDIAFALGVLALLGPRVPLALKVFLAALAIADDIGAVLVIAFFYTGSIGWSSLAWGAGILVALAGANALGVRHRIVYGLLGVALWGAFLGSGVHATIAGVLLAFTIPARTRLAAQEFLGRGHDALTRFAEAERREVGVLANPEQLGALQNLEVAAEGAQAPLQRLERQLHGLVAFGIMPLFALANAGVHIDTAALRGLTGPVVLGIVLGLVIGKPLGITLFAWLAARLHVAERPPEISWGALHGAAWLGGIGFTMSLFIAGLALRDEALLAQAKLGILTASLLAGTVGWLLLRRGDDRAAGAEEPPQRS